MGIRVTVVAATDASGHPLMVSALMVSALTLRKVH
jgi:hypothetical protein